MQDSAVSLDPAARSVMLAGGQTLPYDRLVLSPGIAFRWGALEGYDEAAAERMPHAWKAGPQTALLRAQLEAMDDGGVVAIAVPEPPFRCPPGPYERASLIAHYLKTAKPRSKLLILDASDSFSKQDLFTAAWQELYPGLIEWVPRSQGGQVIRVDPEAMVLHTDFEEVAVAVANVIPPQHAADIARAAGLDEGRGWCAIDGRTFESTVHPGVHLLGDAILAGAMPKSGFSANSQAKVCAAAIAALAARPAAARARADQHLLQPRGARLRHLDRRRLPGRGWRDRRDQGRRRPQPAGRRSRLPPARGGLRAGAGTPTSPTDMFG